MQRAFLDPFCFFILATILWSCVGFMQFSPIRDTLKLGSFFVLLLGLVVFVIAGMASTFVAVANRRFVRATLICLVVFMLPYAAVRSAYFFLDCDSCTLFARVRVDLSSSCLEQKNDFCILHKARYCRGDMKIVRLARAMTDEEISRRIKTSNIDVVVVTRFDNIAVTLEDQMYYFAVFGCYHF